MGQNLFYALCVLQVLDVLTTLYAIKSGKGVEANGILSPFFNAVGLVVGLLTVKLFLVVWLIYFLPLLPVWVLAVLCAGYSWVIYNNVMVLLKSN